MTNKIVSEFINSLNKISGKGLFYLKSIPPLTYLYGGVFCVTFTSLVTSCISVTNSTHAYNNFDKKLSEVNENIKLMELQKTEFKESLEKVRKDTQKLTAFAALTRIQQKEDFKDFSRKLEKVKIALDVDLDWRESFTEEFELNTELILQLADDVQEIEKGLKEWKKVKQDFEGYLTTLGDILDKVTPSQ